MVLADHANVGSFHEVTGGAEPFFEFADSVGVVIGAVGSVPLHSSSMVETKRTAG